tara:strand:+ start:147 stop:773 length:627 start_codon:yes stop_codon:yes gene_type:complete
MVKVITKEEAEKQGMEVERLLKLLPPSDPKVRSAIAPFTDDMLKEHDFKDRKELSEEMFKSMARYGGIGLSANQVGLPFNMFVLGNHLSLENGLKMACFNPMIVSTSEETIMMKEGCLTYPFLFLSIKRPRKCVVKYTDENGDLKEGNLDGMISRIFQHEYEHMLGRNFTEHVSKFKLKRAEEKAKKQFKIWQKQMEARHGKYEETNK